jgi:hypothetical protein
MMATEQQILAFLQTPGLSDQQIATYLGQIGATAQQVSNVTGVPVDQVQSRIAAVTAQATPVPTAAPTAAPTMAPPPRPIVPTPTPTAAPTAAPVRAITPVPTAAPTAAPTNLAQFENMLRTTPGLTDAQILAEMNRLGVNSNQVANITGMPINQIQNRVSNLLPFENATQGFQQQFDNYTSIPIGAQYNRAVVGVAGSPYSQIMSQMQPVGNPYATARSGLAMGGYDPTIYDPNLLSNFVRQRAAELAAAGMPVPLGFDGGGDGPGGAGDGAGSASGDGGPGGAAGGGSGPGDGPGTGAGWYMGGLIDRVSGKNPAGPDDGQINVQVGEYVVKKSSVDKYGKGLLDQINDGKIPAKKMKSLLG